MVGIPLIKMVMNGGWSRMVYYCYSCYTNITDCGRLRCSIHLAAFLLKKIHWSLLSAVDIERTVAAMVASVRCSACRQVFTGISKCH